MKRLFLVLIGLFFLFTTVGADVKRDTQKFNATYEIIYYNITLEDASRLEKIIKEKFKDEYCGIYTRIRPVTP